MNTFHFFLLLFVLTSCKVQQLVQKQHLKPVNQSKQFLIRNHSGNNMLERIPQNEQKQLVALTSLFGLENTSIISVKFEDKKMTLSYTDSLGKLQVRNVNGRFKKNYFYIRFKEKNIFIPLFYSNRKLQKFRIFEAPNNQLFIWHINMHERNILILAGGGTITNHYLFKPFIP
jgi:hypothetical protein